MNWLIGLYGRVKGWMVAAGVAIAAILGAYIAGRRSASQAERDKQARQAQQAAKQKQEVRKDVEKMGDDDLRDAFDRLHGKRRR